MIGPAFIPARARRRMAACIRGVAVGLVCVLGMAMPGTAQAQTTTTYTNTTASAVDGISDTSTPCNNPLVRNFTVSSAGTVSDVNLGIVMAHTYRADIQLVLQSPAGTRVTIFGGVANAADNLNAMLDDEATAAATSHTVDDIATSAASAPPYQRNLQPSNTMTAFDGQSAAGTWRLEICDTAGADSGTFYRADLVITTPPTKYADLSLTSSVSSTTPANYDNLSYTLTVTNAASSTDTATGITVRATLPSSFVYTGSSGTGSYASATGIWTVGTLAPGASATLTISGYPYASNGTNSTATFEITASSAPDSDSTVNNAATGEDDYASNTYTLSATRVAGTPPTLTCPVGTTIFDWDAVTWAAGSTSNNYTIANLGNVQWALTNQGVWMSNATYGGQSPAEQTVVNGAIAGAGQSLFLYADFSTISQTATSTITLPTAVNGAQFRIFDVDYNGGQFADRVVVSGLFNGTAVNPVLTHGSAHYVIGNTAYGDQLSADTAAAGNLVVTFTAPVDTIIITYGNHSIAPTNPGGQAIAIHDITFCRPQANVTMTKVSSVISDPVNGTTTPKMIPGALVNYCILAINGGSGTSTAVTITDALPAGITYVAGSLSSATSCAAAGTAEDDDAAGADESDPFGMSINAGTLVGSAATLGPGGAFALRFNATVN
ncbi:MAG: proprotein convertase P-domain-containing protein [Sphingopyxis sp.]